MANNPGGKIIWVLFFSLVSGIGLLFDDNITGNILFKIIAITGIVILSLLLLTPVIIYITECKHKQLKEIPDKDGNSCGRFECAKCNLIIFRPGKR